MSIDTTYIYPGGSASNTGTTVDSGTSALYIRIAWSAVPKAGVANTSTVTASYQMKRAAVNFSDSSSFSININGSVLNKTNGFNYTPGDSTWRTIFSHQADVLHTANGTKSITISASGVNNNTSWNTGFVSGTALLEDYTILPTTPTSIVLSRTNDGATLSATVSGSTFVGSSAGYYWQYTSDGVNYSTTQSNGATPTVTPTTQYSVRAWANDSEGSSGYAYSGTSYGVPNAPAAPTISNAVTTNLTLSWTAPSNNGSTITSYTIQATTDNGANWSNLYTGVSGTTKNVTGLTIAATYKFRVIAINSIGSSSAGTASASRFISAYGYRNNGTNFSTPISSAKIFLGVGAPGADASGYKMIQNVRRWNGTIWTDLQS